MEPLMGTVMLWAPNFAPRGWAFCSGQLMPIAQYSALFSLLGTTYGGDGRTTFALPDLRGRVPVGAGQSPGLSNQRLGEKGGAEQVTLTSAQMPSHTHAAKPNLTLSATSDIAGKSTPDADLIVGTAVDTNGVDVSCYSDSAADTTLKANSVTGTIAVSETGGNRGHANMQPYLGLNYIIAIEGLFPSRS